MRKQLLLSLLILVFLTLGTLVAILYARGYRFGLAKDGEIISGTGLLVATSTPDGASVFINGHLSTATNNTINLAPGDYDVKIFKDGFFPWEKKIHVEKEVVSKADATLFPTAPKLENITDLGVQNPVIDPSNTKVVYAVASQSAQKNGLYVLNLQDQSLLTLQSNATQIADDSSTSFSKATDFTWSPDGKQILASLPSGNPDKPTLYLLDATSMNANPQDVTETFATTIKPGWDKLLLEKETVQINTLRPSLIPIVQASWKILQWSPDETKILYEATQSATIPQIIKPPLIGTDSTIEERSLQTGSVYVYDTKEDKNFKLLDSTHQPFSPGHMPLSWFPDSKHLIYVHNKQITLEEYDASNPTIVYAGPFTDDYAFPWTNGQKVVILTNLNNPAITPNLYTVDLK